MYIFMSVCVCVRVRARGIVFVLIRRFFPRMLSMDHEASTKPIRAPSKNILMHSNDFSTITVFVEFSDLWNGKKIKLYFQNET